MKESKLKPAAARPSKDIAAGLGHTLTGGRYVTTYSPPLALKICEYIADGATLAAICREPEMPHRQTFHRWVVNFPELARAYSAARELSAYSMEEKALELAEEIRLNPDNSQKVRAYDISMNQLRWSAMRRNPQVFSEKAALQITVPIQINTALDLGDQASGGGTKEFPNIYEIDAKLDAPEPPTTTHKERMTDDTDPLVPPALDRTGPRKRVLSPPEPGSYTLRRRKDKRIQERMKKTKVDDE